MKKNVFRDFNFRFKFQRLLHLLEQSGSYLTSIRINSLLLHTRHPYIPSMENFVYHEVSQQNKFLLLRDIFFVKRLVLLKIK